ncbi:MAG: helix-turn-helix domain-containing protein [Firmicutes bacterium]|nr:helix-turn-helix domain-containing protein [Bacillota bacterium]
MVYYQILKQRRKDLNLSIHDVSTQARLAPQYIAAVEENDMDVFVGDFDFVRRFVKAYAEAIGVNWEFIKDDVDLNISQYVYKKTQAQPQSIVLQNGPELYDIEDTPTFREPARQEVVAPAPTKKKSTKKKKKKKKSSGKSKAAMNKANVEIQKNAKKVARWTKKSRRNFLIAVFVGVVALLLGLNMVLNKISSEQSAADDRARQAELKAKEEETAKLANQKKETNKQNAKEEAEKNKKESEVESESILTCTDQQNNIYTITNLIETDQRLTIEVTLPQDSTIAVYQDDTPINDTETKYEKEYYESFTIDHTCLIQLEITNFQENEIIINGQTITFDTSLWYEGEPAILYFEVKTNDGANYQEDAIDGEEVEEEEEEEV